MTPSEIDAKLPGSTEVDGIILGLALIGIIVALLVRLFADLTYAPHGVIAFFAALYAVVYHFKRRLQLKASRLLRQPVQKAVPEPIELPETGYLQTEDANVYDPQRSFATLRQNGGAVSYR